MAADFPVFEINSSNLANCFDHLISLEDNLPTVNSICEESLDNCPASVDVQTGEEDAVTIEEDQSQNERYEEQEGDAPINKAEDITPAKDGGVTKQILQPGTGDANPSYAERVHICYTGYFPVGSVLKPFTNISETCHFPLGKGVVVRGLDLGIATMRKQEKALFVIQPEYGYGPAGCPPTIPPYCVLFFDVELLDWKLEDLSPKKDDGILRKILQKGEGMQYPNDGAKVKVKMIGYIDDVEFEQREVEFDLGDGCDFGVPEGVEISLLKFKEKEKSMLYLQSPYAFGCNGNEELGIPPNADVKYEVALLAFQRVKEVWDMNSDEKLTKAVECKAKGLKYFQENNYKMALKHFKKILNCLENEPGVKTEAEPERKSLLLSGFLNVALCCMKLHQHIEAIKMCDKALVLEPQSEKALFRRAQCHLEINDYEEALHDFNVVLSINADNKACKNYIQLCNYKIKKQNEKDKRTYNNMFKKFQDQDEEERKRRQMEIETGTWGRESKEIDEEERNKEEFCDEESYIRQICEEHYRKQLCEVENNVKQVCEKENNVKQVCEKENNVTQVCEEENNVTQVCEEGHTTDRNDEKGSNLIQVENQNGVDDKNF